MIFDLRLTDERPRCLQSKIKNRKSKIPRGVVQMRKLLRPAVGVVAAFAVLASLVGATGATGAAARGAGDSARGRAERAIREGDFEVAEKLYRDLLAKDARDAEAR